MDDVEAPGAEERRFDKAFLRTWPAFFKLTEAVLCTLCFLCNELSWYPFVPYPARTFLSVCACLAFICSVLLFLACGCHVDENYSNTTWWRITVVAAPGACGFCLMIASSVQLDQGGLVHAGFRASSVFGFLAFSTYLADAIFQFVQLRGAGQLPKIRMPPIIANNLGKMTGKGAGNGHQAVHVAASVPGQDSDDDVPPSWNIRSGAQPINPGDNRWSQASDDSASGGGSYNLQQQPTQPVTNL